MTASTASPPAPVSLAPDRTAQDRTAQDRRDPGRTELDGPAPAGPDQPGTPRPLRDLERPADAFASLGPNWFASVMGTGIVATAAATLPVQWPGLRGFATAIWLLAAGWLLVLASAEIVHWTRHRQAALGHARNPVMVQFYGAPPMALLTVGAGALLLGPGLIGAQAALMIDAVLWPLGTLAGLASSLAVPYLMFTRLRAAPDAAFGGWLMPVVPPMVSAATGALLIPYLPAGQPRLTLLLACYAMFGISLIASMVVITLLWQRLVRHSIGPAAMVPTLWIVLGPLGQSITAAGLLGTAARLVLPYPYGPVFQAFGVVYGVPVRGFARTLGRPGHRDHHPGRPGAPAVHADLVVVHVPGRHPGDRNHEPRPAHREQRVPLGRGGPVPGPGGRLGGGQRTHRRGHLAGQPAARGSPGGSPGWASGLSADEVAALTRTGEEIASPPA